MNGPELILVKHSLPHIDSTRPASEWRLSEEGRRRCNPLAERLDAHQPVVIVSSREPKAMETAQIVAARLKLPLEAAPDLHEHDRRNVTHLTAEQFQDAVASMFAEPDRIVFGVESAIAAQRRFAQAVSRVMAQHSHRSIAIVAHGTVISLFVARANAVDPRTLWQRLGLPSFVALSLPELKLLEIVETVTG